jgi:hypothetical protein
MTTSLIIIDRQPGGVTDSSCIQAQWTAASLAASGDVGEPLSLAQYSDKTFIVSGTFTGAATVIIEGSNDATAPTNWVQLTNRQGTAMSFAAGGMNTSQDRPIWVRPRLTAGGGGAALLVQVACHRSDLPVDNN